MRVAVTGGLGFIGSAVIRRLITSTDHTVLNIDSETYAATRGSVSAAAQSDRYHHSPVDIADGGRLRSVLASFAPDAVIHLAAESHVDRSIDGPRTFVETNIDGTYHLLEAARAEVVSRGALDRFRFVHVSTDEVFGALELDDPAFDETTPYRPRSPYSASKAAADHLVRAWYETYDLATIIITSSNNYGPFQFPEKLIPLMIIKAAAGQRLPVYGQGDNIRDWLYVEDHARLIVSALTDGQPGETYTIGGRAERNNLDVVQSICDSLDTMLGRPAKGKRRDLITFVEDRPGHDLRYAIDPTKASRELGWEPSVSFEEGLDLTIRWYLDNGWWWRPIAQERYDGRRLGQGPNP
ncbi:MAG: dTDP-glucose 4,6-dehydratase [Actinomycetia bacterium]|nr:dTDP-glucose 4,6-dehydratase [Actinomycetes bacterium]